MNEPQSRTAKLATASLVLGIIALAYPACITGPVAAIAAIILGVLGIKSSRRGFAIAGIILAGLALAMFGTLAFLEYQTQSTLNSLSRDADSSSVP